jgi:hypothetical protein
MESRFIKFTQFIPTALEPRFVSIRSDSITGFSWNRTGDLFCVRIYSGSDSWDIAESFDEVERMVQEALTKDQHGT